eukprot:Polyplicarium_translucidae@DN3742_c0_g1_i1.p1
MMDTSNSCNTHPCLVATHIHVGTRSDTASMLGHRVNGHLSCHSSVLDGGRAVRYGVLDGDERYDTAYTVLDGDERYDTAYTVLDGDERYDTAYTVLDGDER